MATLTLRSSLTRPLRSSEVDANFTALAEFADIGIAVGDSNDFRIKLENGNEAVLANEIGSLITIRAKDSGGSIKNTLKIQNLVN